MSRKIVASRVGIVSALMAFAPAAQAASFDARACSAIENVDVPYDVSFAADRIAFKNGGRQIVVAPSYVEVNDHRLADAALNSTYYRDTRAFLRAASKFPKTAADFAKTAVMPGHAGERRNFASAITSM